LVGSYSYSLVLLSIVVAITASYVALDLTARMVASQGRISNRFWLAGGGVSMGCGIWSMHFIGMLALRSPMLMSYDVPITVLSLLIAMAAGTMQSAERRFTTLATHGRGEQSFMMWSTAVRPTRIFLSLI
jgi:NO-binding membrane sensor protein with MHYT domain